MGVLGTVGTVGTVGLADLCSEVGLRGPEDAHGEAQADVAGPGHRQVRRQPRRVRGAPHPPPSSSKLLPALPPSSLRANFRLQPRRKQESRGHPTLQPGGSHSKVQVEHSALSQLPIPGRRGQSSGALPPPSPIPAAPSRRLSFPQHLSPGRCSRRPAVAPAYQPWAMVGSKLLGLIFSTLFAMNKIGKLCLEVNQKVLVTLR